MTRPVLEAPAAAPVWRLPAEATYAALESSPRGLTAEAVGERTRRHGPNTLPPPRRIRPWRRLLAQFTDLFALVLLVASALTFVAYALQEPRDTGTLQLAFAICGVVVLNAVIGFVQEYSAERTAQALQQMVPHLCRVLRDGARQELPSGALVPGDLVLLEAGDAVPADCRLTEAHALTVNNAALTGESGPVGRTADPSAEEKALTSRNCVFMGTTVLGGSGRAVAYATGAHTEFGKVYRLTQQAPRQKTPLQREVAAMARRVAGLALAGGALVFAVRLPAGNDLVSAFVFALGVMVALVPEGLPATLSVSLAIGVRRMARRQALIKRLLAVEALGSATVVCTDKTGTLTQAEMTVTRLWADGEEHPVSGVGYTPTGTVTSPEAVRALLVSAALCSNSRLRPPSEGRGWQVIGDTTEAPCWWPRPRRAWTRRRRRPQPRAARSSPSTPYAS
ncbi:HAD-IC family P-type ATPase [Streptomyces sp. ODS28]|uniref:HAD-IC family P-type ATPase n=1 Tax=Streptomyces sp. ODS28 TaxID=3136688 RepID=UPI0031E5E9CF